MVQLWRQIQLEITGIKPIITGFIGAVVGVMLMLTMTAFSFTTTIPAFCYVTTEILCIAIGMVLAPLCTLEETGND